MVLQAHHSGCVVSPYFQISQFRGSKLLIIIEATWEEGRDNGHGLFMISKIFADFDTIKTLHYITVLITQSARLVGNKFSYFEKMPDRQDLSPNKDIHS